MRQLGFIGNLYRSCIYRWLMIDYTSLNASGFGLLLYTGQWRRRSFNDHLQDNLRKPVSPFWILLKLKIEEVVVTTGAVICAKLQSQRHHQQTNTHPTILQAGCHSYCPTNSVKALEGKASHSTDLLTQANLGVYLSLTTKSSWLPLGGCQT